VFRPLVKGGCLGGGKQVGIAAIGGLGMMGGADCLLIVYEVSVP